MREFLDFPAEWDPARLNETGGNFPVDRVFSLIGTNHTDYHLARLDVQALNLVPLGLADRDVWNSREHYWGGAKNYLCWSI